MFNVLEFLKNEDEYLPWTAAYSGFAYLRNRFVHENDTLSLIQVG